LLTFSLNYLTVEPRRKFIQQVGLMAGAFSASSLFNQLHAASWEAADKKVRHLSPEAIAADEDYWSVIQQSYTVNSNLIILNNGGVSPSPRIVQEAVERYNRMSNEGPSYYMWRILDQGREPLRQKLALLAGCSPEEIAVNRNATEALNTVIFGLDLKAGDEVIGTKQDYPNMINAWRQRAAREGIVYTQLNFNFPIENDEEIVSTFRKSDHA
jgi:selenocysteine lyase/cysteine desulfurase